MGDKERSAGHDLSRRRLLQVLGWGGAVFAVSFGLPSQSHALPFPSCSGSNADADCGSGYDQTYDMDNHCQINRNTVQSHSDLGCGKDTGYVIIDEDGNCAIAHGTPPSVDVDLDCGNTPDGIYFESDGNCGSGTGDPPGTDVDGRCHKPSVETNTYEDGSCAVRFTSEQWGEMDGNCGFQTEPGIIDSDGNCGTIQMSGAADEDGDCGMTSDGVAYEDASCGMKVGSNKHLDIDGDCHKPCANPPGTFHADNSCGKFTQGGGTLPPRDEDDNCESPSPQGPDPDGMQSPPTPPTPPNPPPPAQD